MDDETAKAKHDGYFFTGDYAKKDKTLVAIAVIGHKELSQDVITSYSIHYTKLYECKNCVAIRTIKSNCEHMIL